MGTETKTSMDPPETMATKIHKKRGLNSRKISAETGHKNHPKNIRRQYIINDSLRKAVFFLMFHRV